MKLSTVFAATLLVSAGHALPTPHSGGEVEGPPTLAGRGLFSLLFPPIPPKPKREPAASGLLLHPQATSTEERLDKYLDQNVQAMFFSPSGPSLPTPGTPAWESSSSTIWGSPPQPASAKPPQPASPKPKSRLWALIRHLLKKKSIKALNQGPAA